MMNVGQHRVPIIERAFTLARSGTCRTVAEVRTRLRSERYGLVDDFISGRGLVAELKKLCIQAYVPPGAHHDGAEAGNSLKIG